VARYSQPMASTSESNETPTANQWLRRMMDQLDADDIFVSTKPANGFDENQWPAQDRGVLSQPMASTTGVVNPGWLRQKAMREVLRPLRHGFDDSSRRQHISHPMASTTTGT
jgi:hypothetical protein